MLTSFNFDPEHERAREIEELKGQAEREARYALAALAAIGKRRAKYAVALREGRIIVALTRLINAQDTHNEQRAKLVQTVGLLRRFGAFQLVARIRLEYQSKSQKVRDGHQDSMSGCFSIN